MVAVVRVFWIRYVDLYFVSYVVFDKDGTWLLLEKSILLNIVPLSLGLPEVYTAACSQVVSEGGFSKRSSLSVTHISPFDP